MNKEAGINCLGEVGALLAWHGLPVFLFQGTALGAYRDQGFTPTERDIDLAILQENFPKGYKLTLLLNDLVRLGFDYEVFTMPFNNPRTIVLFKAYNGHVAKVDLVGLAKWKDKRFTATPVRSWLAEPYCLVHDAKQVENYSQITLFDRTWLVPHPIEAYLASEYGPDWRTPKDDHGSLLRRHHYLESEGIPHDLI